MIDLHIFFEARISLDGFRRDPIGCGYRPNLVVGGNHYPSMLTRVDGALYHGVSGTVEIDAIIPETRRDTFSNGAEIELREGASCLASGRILRVLKVEQ